MDDDDDDDNDDDDDDDDTTIWVNAVIPFQPYNIVLSSAHKVDYH